ncbi:MAG: hypothetical protein GY927_24065 [bacterium]|nr:hypothetical protein [bacterium]
MLLKKLTAALILSGFAVLPVRAGEQAAPYNGTLLQGSITTTAACEYGYAKSKKTRKCIKLKCSSNKMLDKDGHKCVAKTRPGTQRGS